MVGGNDAKILGRVEPGEHPSSNDDGFAIDLVHHTVNEKAAEVDHIKYR